ncbi:exonuclease II Exo2 [Coemansia brasiliensis]|uniref:Exonuclease II Exo2 n=1 Tax=Coemansia brasiliensis TaxID=2650707 RepID=A0A9W8IBG2_9FUNG|nr:exonuclease II Exo2 [Coemansia brasiliensis]
MGIPGLWRWLQQLCCSACRTTTFLDLATPHSLFVDLNSTIHKSARQSNGNIASILDAIDDIVKQVQPQQLLFLSIDGVPPRLKERLQRERRARPQSAKSENWTDPAFSAYFVTPGTKWMRQLESQLCRYIGEKRQSDRVWSNLKVIFSGCRDPGEGEQKIIEFIRQKHSPQQYRHVVWSNDADTVLLALSAHVPSVTVVSERSRGSGSTYSIVDVDELRKLIFQRYAPQTELGALQNIERIVDDLVFLTFFIGNDFVPPLSPAVNSAADDGSCIDDMWSFYSEYWSVCQQYLHNRGNIDPSSLKILLQMLAREREEKQFRQYVGVTQLGPRLTAMRVRRIGWDMQRQKIEEGSSQPDEWKSSLQVKRIKNKHGKKRKSKTLGFRSIAKGSRYIPYVWTGNAAELNADDIVQATGAVPLPANTYPVFTPPKSCTDGIMLKLSSWPLLSLGMVPLYSWVLQAAELNLALSMAGITEPINFNKVVWLGMLAQKFGMELTTYDMDDDEFKSTYKRWKHMRSDPQPQEQAVLAGTPSDTSNAQPSMLLVLERQQPKFTRTQPPTQGTIVSVVNDKDWDVLLADANTDFERQVKYEDWKSAYYWHGGNSSNQAARRERLCNIYANALGWISQYFFAGTVSSWEFSWPEDLQANITGISPLASDLLQVVLEMGDKWTAVPVSSSLPPLLKEHLLSVLPQDAWPSLNEQDRNLARLLFKNDYTNEAREQVHNYFANMNKEAPLVNIWT